MRAQRCIVRGGPHRHIHAVELNLRDSLHRSPLYYRYNRGLTLEAAEGLIYVLVNIIAPKAHFSRRLHNPPGVLSVQRFQRAVSHVFLQESGVLRGVADIGKDTVLTVYYP